VLRPEFDDYFAEVMAAQPHLYLPTLLMDTTDKSHARLLNSYPTSLPLEKNTGANKQARADLLLPAMGKPEHWRLGLVNFHENEDGTARHYQLVNELDGWTLLSLPYVLARDLQLSTTLPTTNHAVDWRLDWRAGDDDHKDKPYTTLSYADVWQKMQIGEKDLSLTGKIVLIGSTAAGLHDLRPTPLSAQYSGLYILANTIDNLKNNAQLYYYPVAGLCAGLLLLGWLWRRLQGNAHLQHTALWFGIWSVLLLLTSTLAILQPLFFLPPCLIPVLSPLLACGLFLAIGSVLRYMQEQQAHAAAIEMFGRFLDPLVVKQLAQEGLNEDTLAGKNCDISVLFSDIRGFTTMSEKATAAEIMSLLNAYFSRQVHVIFQHQGTLDKFIGDAIMAFWGAPLADEQHAIHAVSAALDMVDELLRFRDERGLESFDVGIGIHSGPAVVGMLGSEQRLEYTAIGDTVNLGSRLEGITKGIARILVSQSTRDACGDAFEFIPHGAVTVKGRVEPVNIYEPRRKNP
jgi:adenylate cyclase